MTTATGALEQSLSNYPFGGTRLNTGTANVPYQYTDQELDETGLYFYGARYYDAALGRFISADPLIPDPMSPQDLNRYSYVRNNPLRYTDPTCYSWSAPRRLFVLPRTDVTLRSLLSETDIECQGVWPAHIVFPVLLKRKNQATKFRPTEGIEARYRLVAIIRSGALIRD